MIRWLAPYLVEKVHENGSVQIRTIDEEGIPLLFNGHRLKFYKKPLSKEKKFQFIQQRVKCDSEDHSPQSTKILIKIYKKGDI